MTEYRAHFDATISFVNGGNLEATGFRLDLPSKDVEEGDVARLLVEHLGLALVGGVEFHSLAIVEEPHRGSRGVVTELSEPPRPCADRRPEPHRAGGDGHLPRSSGTGDHAAPDT